MSALAESIAAARARNYRDADDQPDAIDWDDPVARVAAALDTFSYETPERVLMMVAQREQLEVTWAGKHPTKRQLLRRRAAILLEIGDGA